MRAGRSAKGFTLVETLAAMLIVTLLTGAIAVGTSTAVKIHSAAVFASESELLAATVNAALGDVLRYADYDPVEEDFAITNQGYGILQGRILLRDGRLYINTSSLPDDSGTLLILVSDGAYTTLRITDFTISYSAEDALFSGGYTITNQDGTRQRTAAFTFRPVNA